MKTEIFSTNFQHNYCVGFFLTIQKNNSTFIGRIVLLSRFGSDSTPPYLPKKPYSPMADQIVITIQRVSICWGILKESRMMESIHYRFLCGHLVSIPIELSRLTWRKSWLHLAPLPFYQLIPTRAYWLKAVICKSY